MPKIDGQRVVADLKRLAEFGRYKTGVHRPTYSPVDVESRHWLAGKFRDMVAASWADEAIARIQALPQGSIRDILELFKG